MECSELRDRIAGWLDDELSRSERALFGQHLSRCEGCRALVAQVAAVDPRPGARDPIGEGSGFWADMDAALAAELDRATAPSPAASRRRGGPRWELRVSVPIIVGYAALLLLSVVWALVAQDRARSAEAANAELSARLEAVQGQNDPQPAVPATATRLAVTTGRHRGKF